MCVCVCIYIYIVLRGPWCVLTILNVQAPTEENVMIKGQVLGGSRTGVQLFS